jgi:arylsulfatase A-like enzyme
MNPTRLPILVEMFANRAIYNDGWIACTTPPLAPWEVGKTIDVDDYKWELYNVDQDFSEANDLAAKTAKKVTVAHARIRDWLRGWDLNPRPSGYEPDELPGCSTPRFVRTVNWLGFGNAQLNL